MDVDYIRFMSYPLRVGPPKWIDQLMTFSIDRINTRRDRVDTSRIQTIDIQIESGKAGLADISGSAGIAADFYSIAPAVPRPLIIISHGFLGYRRWGFFPYLSRHLAVNGFHVLTFSFSHCGVDEGTGKITRPDLFASNSVSREIIDLKKVISFAHSEKMPVNANGTRWGLLGHSRGGAVSILVSPDSPEIASIVTWSALSKLDRYTERRKKEWKKRGRLAFNESRAESGLWLDYSYFEDIDAHREQYDLSLRASELKIPHLIVHGRRDAAVTLKEAEGLLLHPRAAEVKMEILEGCGHSFGAVHPMTEPADCLVEACCLSSEWFEKTLKRSAGR
ncbi:MAG: alpha/beta fold hydrolase [Bacteroidales bacterium]|nr:alpha/beta fold hydrolase [Candidatus Latescibacterota bacterium]